MKIWAKIITKHRKVKDVIYSDELTLNFDNYEIMLRGVAALLDISTPLTMEIHYQHFSKFNIHKFKAPDFIEPINFDYLELENLSD